MVDGGQIPISYNNGGGGWFFDLYAFISLWEISYYYSVFTIDFWAPSRSCWSLWDYPLEANFVSLRSWTLTRVSTFSSLCFSRNIHKMCPSILHEAFWDQVCYIIGPDDLGRPFRLTRWFCSSAYFLLLIDFLSFFMIVIGVILVTTSV